MNNKLKLLLAFLYLLNLGEFKASLLTTVNNNNQTDQSESRRPTLRERATGTLNNSLAAVRLRKTLNELAAAEEEQAQEDDKEAVQFLAKQFCQKLKKVGTDLGADGLKSALKIACSSQEVAKLKQMVKDERERCAALAIERGKLAYFCAVFEKADKSPAHFGGTDGDIFKYLKSEKGIKELEEKRGAWTLRIIKAISLPFDGALNAVRMCANAHNRCFFSSALFFPAVLQSIYKRSLAPLRGLPVFCNQASYLLSFEYSNSFQYSNEVYDFFLCSFSSVSAAASAVVVTAVAAATAWVLLSFLGGAWALFCSLFAASLLGGGAAPWAWLLLLAVVAVTFMADIKRTSQRVYTVMTNVTAGLLFCAPFAGALAILRTLSAYGVLLPLGAFSAVSAMVVGAFIVSKPLRRMQQNRKEQAFNSMTYTERLKASFKDGHKFSTLNRGCFLFGLALLLSGGGALSLTASYKLRKIENERK